MKVFALLQRFRELVLGEGFTLEIPKRYVDYQGLVLTNAIQSVSHKALFTRA